MREIGFSALQVWQSLSEAQGRGRGDRELAILFTDLVDFSDWALDAGDERAVELLRRVGQETEPVDRRARRPRSSSAWATGSWRCSTIRAPRSTPRSTTAEAVERIELDGHRPQQRAGVHLGRPRRLGSDYFGVDVNVAARVASAAGPGQVLVSQAARDRLDDAELRLRRRWRFKAKGAPKDLEVYAAARS